MLCLSARRRSLLMGANRKHYTILLQGLSTVSHTPTFANPATITDVGDVVDSQYRIWIKLNDETAITYDMTAPLRCTYSPANDTLSAAYATIGSRDYVEITENTVKLYRYVSKYTLPGSGDHSVNHDGTTVTTLFQTNSFIEWAFTPQEKQTLSTHFKPTTAVTNTYTTYASNGITHTGARLYFFVVRTDVGGTSANTNAEIKALYNTYMTGQRATLGDANCALYLARTVPVVTDLTTTPFGVACISLVKRCHGEGITSNTITQIQEVI